ncbi:hypothetical protein C9186_23990 [Escherichia coli]|nr:hypothetical protein I3S_19100 [Escherichia coli O121 str. RM8352]EFI3760704.1 hypothetical protein [Escherichia coli]QCH71252.1 hypothetical protein B9X35_006685 [Escherichia coli O121:H19]KAA9811072.1 hypothetical protein F7F76_24700 [Escherichia coli]KAA9979493.1 hypothetical protein F7F42_24370 [Escherichia coli]
MLSEIFTSHIIYPCFKINPSINFTKSLTRTQKLLYCVKDSRFATQLKPAAERVFLCLKSGAVR